jgi:hypothetical protein
MYTYKMWSLLLLLVTAFASSYVCTHPLSQTSYFSIKPITPTNWTATTVSCVNKPHYHAVCSLPLTKDMIPRSMYHQTHVNARLPHLGLPTLPGSYSSSQHHPAVDYDQLCIVGAPFLKKHKGDAYSVPRHAEFV